MPSFLRATLEALAFTGIASTAAAGYPWGPALTSSDTGQMAGWGRVRFDPTSSNTIWAATTNLPDPFSSEIPDANGLWKTTDGGTTWTMVNSGPFLATYNILDFSICEADPNVVYVATQVGGVFKTTDGGSTWSEMNTGLTHKGAGFPNTAWGVGTIAVDPTDPNKVYCSVGQVSGLDIFNLSPDHPGFFYSHDGGANWTGNNDGLPPREDSIIDGVSNTTAGAFIVIPSRSPGTLYMGMLQAEANINALFGRRANAATLVYKNTSSGTGPWTSISDGLPSVPQSPVLFGSVARIAASTAVLSITEVGPRHVLYLSNLAFGIDVSLTAEQQKSKSSGIYILPPGSTTWEPHNTGLPVVNDEENLNAINTSPVGVHPADPYTLLTGVLDSDPVDPGADKIWATQNAGEPWLKNWTDTGLENSPTLGLPYCQAAFVEISRDGRKAVASISWDNEAGTGANDDDGVYLLPPP